MENNLDIYLLQDIAAPPAANAKKLEVFELWQEKRPESLSNAWVRTTTTSFSPTQTAKTLGTFGFSSLTTMNQPPPIPGQGVSKLLQPQIHLTPPKGLNYNPPRLDWWRQPM
jgi:hypothetical protein